MLIFSFPFFFSIVRKVVEEEKRRKKMNTSCRVCVFFCFVMGKSFAMRFCNTVVIVVATTMYIYFFSLLFLFTSIAALMVCTGMLFSFFFFFFRFNSLSLCLLPFYSVTIHFTRVFFCLNVCHMYFFPS